MRRRPCSAFFITLICVGGVSTGASSSPPRQLQLSLSNDATAMWLSWSTTHATTTSHVMYGNDEGHLSQSAQGTSHPYSDVVIHRARIDISRYPPETTLYYRCGDSDAGLSETHSFRTPPHWNVNREMVIPMYGDMGITNADATYAQLLKLVNHSDFFYHVGDIGYADDYTAHKRASGLRDYEVIWNHWADWMTPITSQVAYMTAPGNHEADCHNYGRLFCHPDYDNFTAYNTRYRMPGPESGGADSMWYSFDYGNVHFVTINTETDFPGAPEQDGAYARAMYNCGKFGNQLEWLTKDLTRAAANRARVPWIIVVGHRPFYSTAAGSLDAIIWGNVPSSLRRAFESTLKKFSVDLYIAGHVHAYERHLPVYDGKVAVSTEQDPYHHPRATVHVTPGGPGNVEGLDSHWQTLNSTKFPWFGARNYTSNGYGVLKVRNVTNLHWSYRNSIDGSIIDEFELVKPRGHPAAS